MMLSTSRTVQRLPPLRTRTTAGKVCRPVQTRAFRFGIWSSYLDSAYHRELRRRHWTLKHKYLDSIGKRLSWHDHPFAEESRFTPKRTVTRFWPPTVVRSGFPWVNQEEIDSRKTASRPTYPPFRFDVKLRNAKLWGSYLDHIIEPLLNQTSSDAAFRSNSKASADCARANTKPEKPKPQKPMRSDTNATIEQDYMIDPITNRKVPKRGHGPSGLEPPIRTPKLYRSQFAPFVPPNLDSERPPVYSNGQPPAAELSKYAENKFDDWPAAINSSSAEPAESSVRPEAASHTFDSSTLRNEEYSLNHLPLEDPIEDHDDLHKYQTTTSNKSFLKSSDTKSTSDSDHLQPDSKSQQLQSELQKYGPYTYNEDSPSSTDPEELKDLEQYRHRVSEVPESSTEQLSTYDDLHKYEPRVLDEPKDQDKLFEQYGDLEKYKDFRTQHLDTAAPMECDTVAESLKEYEAKEQGDGISDANNAIIRGVPRQIPKMTLPEGHVFSKHYSSQTGPGKTNSPNDSSRENLRQQMNELSATSDAMNNEISSDLQKTRQDFTEDKSIIRDEEKNLKQDESDISKKQFAQSALDQFRNISRLEPALNRRASATKRNRLNRVFGGDFYSKEPQGLETSFSEECGGRQTMPLYTRTYGGEPGQATPRTKFATESESKGVPGVESDTYYHRDPEIDGIPSLEPSDSTRSQKTTQPDEPTVYKILAYDPSTQSIKIAETSSVVPDSTSPISPTEVLPRLSNPTKFFPHFAPLQAEGFEIVSGSGNVLVFRQMRPAKAAAQDGTTYVNPIDMMGRSAAIPNAAAFVSPTGFVNYDMPGVGEEIADRAGRSGPSVDREGPNSTLGEKQSTSQDKKGKKKRMNVGKRIVIGGAWAAGISYAIGVVSEYFYTGGTDGKGPEGFSPI